MRDRAIVAVREALMREHVGDMLREWRQRRRLSQLSLALDAGVSARHLSFVETGRSRPSADMLLTLAQLLGVPLREQNRLLLASGYAPRYPETPLTSPDAAAVLAALRRLLDAHDPYPGVVLDRHWNVVLANTAATMLTSVVPTFLLKPTPNIFRMSLHPQGIAAFTLNFEEWGRYMLDALARMNAMTADPVLDALAEEVAAYPNVRALPTRPREDDAALPLLVPCTLELNGKRLSLFTALAAFGGARDVMLSELTTELFYPADEATARTLREQRSFDRASG